MELLLLCTSQESEVPLFLLWTTQVGRSEGWFHSPYILASRTCEEGLNRLVDDLWWSTGLSNSVPPLNGSVREGPKRLSVLVLYPLPTKIH